MKKILIIIFILNSIVHANTQYELILYERIVPSVFGKNSKIFVEKNSMELFLNSDKLILVNDCKVADVLIGKNFTDLPKECEGKPVFSTSYRSFVGEHNSIGAFYWKRYKPTIIFRNSTLNRFSLALPKSLQRYSK